MSYQRKFLEDNSKRVVLKWSRQSGKSTCLALKALWFAVCHTPTTTLIVSPSLRQSINLRDIVTRLIERIPHDARRLIVKRALRTTIYLWEGSRIVALPANPDTLRGYTAHMILVDEADFFRDPEGIFYGTLHPMLTSTDGWLIVSSTPWSTKGFYYRVCGENSGYSRHFANWRDAVAAGVAKESIVEEARKSSPPEVFRREYECEFVEDVNVFLSSDLIARCIDPTPLVAGRDWDYYPFEAEPEGEFYVGCDFGKHQDYSVVAVVDRRPDGTLRLVHLWRPSLETPYASVVGYVKALSDRYNHVVGVKADMTGVGDYIVEEMARAGIPNVEGVNFTRASKEEVAVPVKQAMLQGRIKIPYDRCLIAELNVERYEMSKDGHFIFSHPERTHDDRFWAFMLACHMALESVGGVLSWREKF
ncbi:MAG: terminase family protein [Candidatus Bathyarchaeia archaeon]